VTRGRKVAVASVVLAVVIVALVWRCSGDDPPDRVLVAAAGGMACDPLDPEYAGGEGTAEACRQRAVSDVVVAADPDAVFGLGDYQYEEPKAASYAAVYDPTWGRLKDRTRPALGNQEYKVNKANTFFEYFGDRAGPPDGWYRYSVGRWDVVVLNTNCTQVGGCDATSPQARWLDEELTKGSARCTVAYWHHPRFSTGLYGSDTRSRDLWAILQDHGVDLVVAAHEHDYQRFDRLDADGQPSASGITSFVVGTGGQAHYTPDDDQGYAETRRGEAQSEARVDDAFGALLLDLDADGWASRFVDDRGRVRDRAEGRCR
jgi:hypothetical protein